ELRHLLLTHVHLGHAGAAGALVAENPRLRVHVHGEGAPHLARPERWVASAREGFGAAQDALFGETRPVPPDAIRVWERGRRGPHAVHGRRAGARARRGRADPPFRSPSRRGPRRVATHAG